MRTYFFNLTAGRILKLTLLALAVFYFANRWVLLRDVEPKKGT